MPTSFGTRTLLAAGLTSAFLAVPVGAALAQQFEARPLRALDGKAEPPPMPNLAGIVKDRNAAIALGKALFWDMQVGTDGLACASCHFHAGADARLVNQVNPGMLFTDANGNTLPSGLAFENKVFGTPSGPNEAITPDDYDLGAVPPAPRATLSFNPFTSTVEGPVPFPPPPSGDPFKAVNVPLADDVVASQGAFLGGFVSSVGKKSRAGDQCSLGQDDVFHKVVSGKDLMMRRVEPRQTPTVINAAYNTRQFWDGRAGNVFNGNTPFGARTKGAKVVVAPNVKKKNDLTLETMALVNASLASQAVGPPLSDFEMSCANRQFADIGVKLLGRKPLRLQKVSPTDSVLGPHAASNGKGLKDDYRKWIEKAFHEKYTAGGHKWIIRDGKLVRDSKGYTQQELNFSMYFGVALALYQSTLVSDDSPFDRFMKGQGDLSDDAKAGMAVFNGEGRCIACHDGPLMSKAAATAKDIGRFKPVDRLNFSFNGSPAVGKLFDTGFYNVAVRPIEKDLGVGGVDPDGNPLSYAQQVVNQLRDPGRKPVDDFEVDLCEMEYGFTDCTAPADGELEIATKGAFKAPTLRNVALTAPYFHNGRDATLADVIGFYTFLRTTGSSGLESENTHPAIGVLPFGQPSPGSPFGNFAAFGQLEAFLKTLTDERVRCDKAPFDHPELFIPNGHKKMDGKEVDENGDGRADDVLVRIPAVGRSGYANENECIPNTGNMFDMDDRLEAWTMTNEKEIRNLSEATLSILERK